MPAREHDAPILVLGARGMLGTAVVRSLERRGRTWRGPSRDELDLARPDEIGRVVEALAPRAVINAAAFNDVDAAELPQSQREVFLVNRDGPGALALACRRLGIPVVHVSTDYVFDGSKREPYREDDPPRPLQTYGRSKLEGEQAVLSACPTALVVRTSTLFGPEPASRNHYVAAIRRQSRQRKLIEVVETPVSSPSYTPDVSEAILKLVAVEASGVVHVVNAGACSRLELARAVLELVGRLPEVELRTRPATGGSAPRPTYSVLDISRLTALTGTGMRGWKEALAAYLRASPREGA